MASRFLLGFVGGASKYGADMLEQRQKDEAEIRKEKMLQELRAAQAKDQFIFEEGVRQGRTNTELSGPDYTTGKFVFRDAEGRVKSERPLTDAEMQDRKLSLDKVMLETENVRSTIDSRKHDDSLADRNYALNAAQTAASIDSSRASAGYSRAATKRLDDPTTAANGGDPDLAAAAVLLKNYSKEIDALQRNNTDPTDNTTKEGFLDDVAIRQAALAIVKNSRTGAEAEANFNQWLIRANKGLAQRNPKGKIRSLDGN